MAFAQKKRTFQEQLDSMPRPTQADLEKFIAERKPPLSKAELDAITEKAFANVDKEQFIREGDEMRREWKRECEERARSKAK